MSQPWPPSGEQPYGPPQTPPQPYGQRYAPQQPQPQPLPEPQSPYLPQPAPQPVYVSVSHAAPTRSQGLAITSLALSIVGVALSATPLRAIGLLCALVAGILAIIAMAAKAHGGTKFAVTGLVLAMLSLPVAFLMWMWVTESAKSDVERQKALQECITKNPERVLECAGWN